MTTLHLSGIIVILALFAVGAYYARALVVARRAAHLAILEREQRFRCLAEATFEGIIVHRDGVIVDANEELAKMFGPSHAQLVGLPVSALLEPRDVGSVLDLDVAKGGVPVDLTGHRQDGTSFPAEARSRLFQTNGTAHIMAIRDVSEREASARALRESEGRLRSLVDTVGAAIVLLSTDHSIIEWNQEAERLYGMKKSSVLGKNYLEHCTTGPTSSVVAEAIARVRAGSECRGLEYPVPNPAGAERMARWNLMRMLDAEGKTVGILACGQDITEIRAAHARTLKALRGKEVLLQEVYHRVKNNLQVVDSLLNRQAAGLAKELQEPLKEAQSRIRSLSAVHEFLYQTEDLERIDFAAYTRRLVADLRRSHGLDTRRLALKLDADGVRLGLETAAPCGLILNELITNTCKYAFPDGRDGEIEIAMHATAERNLVLSYNDNGCGPGTHAANGPPGFGLQLVRDLTYQLGGSVTTSESQGAGVILFFPCGPHDQVEENGS